MLDRAARTLLQVLRKHLGSLRGSTEIHSSINVITGSHREIQDSSTLSHLMSDTKLRKTSPELHLQPQCLGGRSREVMSVRTVCMLHSHLKENQKRGGGDERQDEKGDGKKNEKEEEEEKNT